MTRTPSSPTPPTHSPSPPPWSPPPQWNDLLRFALRYILLFILLLGITTAALRAVSTTEASHAFPPAITSIVFSLIGLGVLVIARKALIWLRQSPHLIPINPLDNVVNTDRCPIPIGAAPPSFRGLSRSLASATLCGVKPLSPLAMALLERYAEVPHWPASPTQNTSAHGTTTLLDHVLGVRANAMDLTIQYGISPVLAELAALGHDLGKLAAYRQNQYGQWTRISSFHDRLSASLIGSIREWDMLLPQDQADLTIAVAFHHRPHQCPLTASPRALSLLRLLREADRLATTLESAAPHKKVDVKQGVDRESDFR